MEKLFFGGALVIPITPYRLNERMAAQQGLFLFPCNLEIDFEENICSAFGFPFTKLITENVSENSHEQSMDEMISEADIVKIIIPRDVHKEALEDLHSMNIDTATLFPGLEGFARSLKFLVRSLEELDE